ncbi:hypothetical protein H9I32_08270 [Bacillus sp. Xin]|uniref:hypothetical protein n=1 Tax=unclassified Bacillus (in: firmicutes) TaxID=185979 RepID=UPI001573F941|nr:MULTISPECIES: hypothetical protein [unclassified Bacillus (in: firmicutes)]MBC6972406.1 hypothetical protein [Bacillus sp. Xin]NSW38395.1 hypothetical protein [Bacillus sp. Xin1]
MKKVYWSKLTLFALFLFLLIPTSSVAYGKTISTASDSIEKKNNGKPYMELYSQTGDLIKSYSQEEMNELKQQIIAPDIYKIPEGDGEPFGYSMDANGNMISSSNKELLNVHRAAIENVKEAGLSVYNYEKTEFKGHVWIGQGRDYHKPKNIVVEAKRKFSEMKIQILHEESEIGSVKIGNFVGVLNVPVAPLTEQSGNVKIKFINKNGKWKDVYLNGGQVYFE